MDFNSLREQYPLFLYHGYETEYRDGNLCIVYAFEVPGLCSFAPQWKIPCPQPDLSDPALRRLVFSLGLTELVSYWKIACPPEVEIRCGTLSAEQADWWKTLYFGGLGEFFYRNGIETGFDTFMHISCTGRPLPDTPAGKPLSGRLIPVGGGKDSIVTLNLLQGQLENAFAYQINHRNSSEAEALLAGIPKERICEVSRTLDPNMLECNKKGFLNGHTPFSAIVAFSAVLCAYLHGLGEVILSNESSASESTVSESEVNHQYSKSYAFERDFFAYERDFLRCGIRYYSLLRPLTEFQIARFFADCDPQYHALFRSCNAGAKQDKWCGHCAKCLFVAVILSPFLPYEKIQGILGSDILNLPDMEPVLNELTGAAPNKPFECVGSRNEVNIALCLAAERMEQNGEEMPLLLRKYRESAQYAAFCGEARRFGQEWDENHNLPADLAALVREKCLTRYQ